MAPARSSRSGLAAARRRPWQVNMRTDGSRETHARGGAAAARGGEAVQALRSGEGLALNELSI